MDQVPQVVEEDVSVVPVLDVEEVASQRVPAEAFHEMLLSLLEVLLVSLFEKVVQVGVPVHLLLQRIKRKGVGNEL